ncbi:lanthionine synthetase C family protein [Amycolatopsis nalaikhensis]|uniref:Lanthionine synthetase C family protein n=1 Tax=Amycolatopsis nalaikhensis TaxID=715472 RepID=A0ABY8XQQ1_9PSEU|nr:lanthionine synthetase C family protein [Amycolatopsis sp. 2-2]WIV57852.1 lanthionine synthetase C family protein [Amycolatopsis sp. 2-2]
MSRPHPQALATAAAIADRLAHPNAVRSVHHGNGRSRPQSLAGGAAGIALLHIERARAGHGDWNTAHTWLTIAARDNLSAGPNANLYFGAPTLAFVTRAAADRPGKLARALTDLDASTIALTRRRLDDAHARIDRGDQPALAEFDLIRGLAGLGSYHLRRHPDDDVTRAVLSYLVRLTEPLPDNPDGLPGWWTDVSPNGDPSPDFPAGHGNLGMSHGIAAPLALLSLAMLRGVVVEEHVDAIARICAWLDTWQQEQPSGSWWPGYITLDHVYKGHVEESSHQRPSWCYGTPGIARAQQLAGLATGNVARQRAAEAAMLGCLQAPDQLDRLPETGLCHGMAGLFQVAWRMAADADTPDIANELPGLTERLLAGLESAPEDAEFLDGHAGVALALQTAGTDTAPLTHWDACLLLA